MADNFQRKAKSPVMDVPTELPEVGLNEFDANEASQFANEFVTEFRNNTGSEPSTKQIENAFDLKTMERMSKGMSTEQQEAMARHFDHYALLSALMYQFKYLDKFLEDMNNAYAVMNKSREES